MRLTQEQIDELKELHDKLCFLPDEYFRITQEERELRSLCDHKYPNGSDACTYDADGRYCKICKKLI